MTTNAVRRGTFSKCGSAVGTRCPRPKTIKCRHYAISPPAPHSAHIPPAAAARPRGRWPSRGASQVGAGSSFGHFTRRQAMRHGQLDHPAVWCQKAWTPLLRGERPHALAQPDPFDQGLSTAGQPDQLVVRSGSIPFTSARQHCSLVPFSRGPCPLLMRDLAKVVVRCFQIFNAGNTGSTGRLRLNAVQMTLLPGIRRQRVLA